MKSVLSLCIVVFSLSFAFGQSPPTPTKFSIKSDKTKFTACRLIKVTAEGGGKTVLWRYEGDLADIEIDGKVFRFVASGKVSTVTIRAYTASSEGDVLEAVLVLESDIPPQPPIPPPLPPTPTPSDPLVEEIRKLVTPTEKVELKKLAALYELIAKECLSNANKSASDINGLYKQAAINLVGDKLKVVREKLSHEIINACPDDPDAELTPSQRNTLYSTFLRLQKICLEA